MIQDIASPDILFNAGGVGGFFVKVRYFLANIPFDSPMVWIAIGAIILSIVLLRNSEFIVKMIGLCLLLAVLAVAVFTFL